MDSTQSPDIKLPLSTGLSDRKELLPAIIRLSTSSNEMVQIAAPLTLMGGDDALIALVALLKRSDRETVSLAMKALASFRVTSPMRWHPYLRKAATMERLPSCS